MFEIGANFLRNPPTQTSSWYRAMYTAQAPLHLTASMPLYHRLVDRQTQGMCGAEPAALWGSVPGA